MTRERPMICGECALFEENSRFGNGGPKGSRENRRFIKELMKLAKDRRERARTQGQSRPDVSNFVSLAEKATEYGSTPGLRRCGSFFPVARSCSECNLKAERFTPRSETQRSRKNHPTSFFNKVLHH